MLFELINKYEICEKKKSRSLAEDDHQPMMNKGTFVKFYQNFVSKPKFNKKHPLI